MTHPRWFFAVSFVVVVALAMSFVAGHAQTRGDEILPGCNLPKSYGRLVTLTGPSADGLAGQAVFEDGEGIIRWVGLMFNPQANEAPRPQRRPVVMFPAMPRYECTLGHVWQRH